MDTTDRLISLLLLLLLRLRLVKGTLQSAMQCGRYHENERISVRMQNDIGAMRYVCMHLGTKLKNSRPPERKEKRFQEEEETAAEKETS